MSRRILLVSVCVLCTFFLLLPAAAKDLIPAGTILQCTMDEVNFSSKTAMVGDPVLCHLGPLGSFGHSMFPRGAMLGGHLEDYKNPGHFVGKGWLQIEFDHLVLPNAEIIPLAAKIVSAPHLKTDAQGDMHSKGHPKRDALLWAVPPLWPIKIITLPDRGPYPALKGESRLALRVMEDVELPQQVAKNVPMPPWASPASYQMSSTPVFRPASMMVEEPAAKPQITFDPHNGAADGPVTVIALHAGTAMLAQRYWVEGGKLHCVSDGVEQEIPLEKVDLTQTVKLNQERNVEFTLQSKDAVEQ
jgi:hypothetical protein